MNSVKNVKPVKRTTHTVKNNPIIKAYVKIYFDSYVMFKIPSVLPSKTCVTGISKETV